MGSSPKLGAIVKALCGKGDAEGKTRLLDMAQSPLDMLVLTVLSQATSDRNSAQAFGLLKARYATSIDPPCPSIHMCFGWSAVWGWFRPTGRPPEYRRICRRSYRVKSSASCTCVSLTTAGRSVVHRVPDASVVRWVPCARQVRQDG